MPLCQAFGTSDHDLDKEPGLIKDAASVGLLSDGQVDVTLM